MLFLQLQSISNSVLRKTRKMNFVLGLWMLLELIVFVASLLEDDSIVEAFIISIVFGIIFWLFLFAILLMGGAIKII
nr:MAG TPA: hypothetical protein [Caudoviricetes sp.]